MVDNTRDDSSGVLIGRQDVVTFDWTRARVRTVGVRAEGGRSRRHKCGLSHSAALLSLIYKY